MKIQLLFVLLVALVMALVLMFNGTHRFSSMHLPRARMLTEENDYSIVMINAYARSGSSFFSHLLTFRNDTFYWFEPLLKQYPSGFYDNEKRLCSTLRSSCQLLSLEDPKSINRALKFLTDIYSCSFEHHIDRFLDKAMGRLQDEPYKKCRKDGSSISDCYPVFTRHCESSKHIVTKVLRLSIQLAEPLLEKLPNLKVLKLLRDPRAIINSRMNTRWYYKLLDKGDILKSVEDNAEILCRRMRCDIESVQMLAKKFPNRVRIIQYEDIVGVTEKPEAIYEYLEMDPSATDSRMVKLLGESKNYRPDAYRKKMSKNTLEIVQKHCADVIEMLGLKVFASYREMANLSVSVIQNRLPYAM